MERYIFGVDEPSKGGECDLHGDVQHASVALDADIQFNFDDTLVEPKDDYVAFTCTICLLQYVTKTGMHPLAAISHVASNHWDTLEEYFTEA